MGTHGGTPDLLLGTFVPSTSCVPAYCEGIFQQKETNYNLEKVLMSRDQYAENKSLKGTLKENSAGWLLSLPIPASLKQLPLQPRGRKKIHLHTLPHDLRRLPITVKENKLNGKGILFCLLPDNFPERQSAKNDVKWKHTPNFLCLLSGQDSAHTRRVHPSLQSHPPQSSFMPRAVWRPGFLQNHLGALWLKSLWKGWSLHEQRWQMG